MTIELGHLNDLKTGRVRVLQIGPVPTETHGHLRTTLGIVHLSTASINHILEEHPDINILDLLVIPFLVRDGLWIADRPGACCISYVHPEDAAKRYISAVKSVADGHELYLTTFHRAGRRQTKSLLKRGPILRRHR